MELGRKSRAEVALGIDGETVFAGDHIAYFYSNDSEFERAFAFFEEGFEKGDHCLYFGIPEDIGRAVRLLSDRDWDVDALIGEGQLSLLQPGTTCDETLELVSAHFGRLFESGVSFIRFLGNAAVGRPGWPAEDEFFKLEAAVSQATLNMPVVAICMFDLRSQPGTTLMHAAFEGHPVTFHRNCVRENPYYVPRSKGIDS